MALGHQNIALSYPIEYVTENERDWLRGKIYNSCYIPYSQSDQQEWPSEDTPNARASTITPSGKGFNLRNSLEKEMFLAPTLAVFRKILKTPLSLSFRCIILMIDFNGINFVICFVVSFYYCKACMLEWTNEQNTNKETNTSHLKWKC